VTNEEIVIYQGKEYTIVHQYDSGYVEIRNQKSRSIELVHKSELLLLNDSDPKKNDDFTKGSTRILR
jgi:hypothetical protein